MAAARKGRRGVDCPPYVRDRLSEVVRSGVVEDLRTSFSPPEGLPDRMVELLKRLDAVSAPREHASGGFAPGPIGQGWVRHQKVKRDEGRTQMTDFDDVGRKATQKASETAEKGRKATEETVRGVEQSYSAAFDSIRNLNMRLIDAAQANADGVCALARDIANTKTPSDLLAAWMKHAHKQFDMTTKQANDLTALGHKFATESAAPMIRNFQQAFTQGTTERVERSGVEY